MPATNLVHKLSPGDIKLVEFRRKHVSVTLRRGMTLDEARSKPELWTAIQANASARLNKGDFVDLVMHDGSAIAEAVPVLRIDPQGVYLGKPLRVISFEEVALFEDMLHRVVPNGTGFSIETKRDGRTDTRIFNTVEAAKVELARRQPVRVA